MKKSSVARFNALSSEEMSVVADTCDFFELALLNEIGKGEELRALSKAMAEFKTSELQCDAAIRQALFEQLLDLTAEHCYREKRPISKQEILEHFSPEFTDVILEFSWDENCREDAPFGWLGKYALQEEIGRGGMGVVYRATQSEGIRREVAIKIVKPERLDKESLQRFEFERQALAAMDHEGIARVFDVGTSDDGRAFVVMELISGKPLTDFCDAEKLTVDDRLRVFSLVCDAVQHAHQKGIIHRDLKPTNILSRRTDKNGFAIKVIDFGLARVSEQGQGLTEFGQFLGTREYLSPEQAGLNPDAIDIRTDVYSLGVLLYELLTGSTPITREQLSGSSLKEVIDAVTNVQPPLPSKRLGDSSSLKADIAVQRQSDLASLKSIVRGDLDWIVSRAIEKDPDRRYRSAADFSDDINRFRTNKPVLAVPPSATYRIKKWAQRNRIGLAIAMFGLLAITAFSYLFYENNRVEAERKREARDAALRLEEKEQQRLREEFLAEAELKEKESYILASTGSWPELLRTVSEYESETNEKLPLSLLLLKLRAADAISSVSERMTTLAKIAEHPDIEIEREVIDVFRFLNGNKVSNKRILAIAEGKSQSDEARLIAIAMTTNDKGELIGSLEAVWADARNFLHLPAGRLLTNSYLWLGEFENAQYVAAQMRQLYPDDPLSEFTELWVAATSKNTKRYQGAVSRFKKAATVEDIELAEKLVEIWQNANGEIKNWRIQSKIYNSIRNVFNRIGSSNRMNLVQPSLPKYFSARTQAVGLTFLKSRLVSYKTTAESFLAIGKKYDYSDAFFAAAVFYFLEGNREPASAKRNFQNAISACSTCLELPSMFQSIHEEALFLRGLLSAATQIISDNVDDPESVARDLLEYRRRCQTLPPEQLFVLPGMVRLGDASLSKAIIKDYLHGLTGQNLTEKANELLSNSRSILRANPEVLQLSFLVQIGNYLKTLERSEVTVELLEQIRKELKTLASSISKND